MKRPHATCFGLALLVELHLGASALAAGDIGSPEAARVPLGCDILADSILAITNTSGSTIPEGTEITYDGLGTAYGEHYGGTFKSAALLPGEIIRKPATASKTCTAWFTLPVASPPAQ